MLKELNPLNSLAEQLNECFVVDSPIWMDSSTQDICDELENEIGSQKLSEITGSRAYCRFTLSQIAKQYRLKNLENCERISLVSSFFGSLFLNKYMPIDYSDATGMNLFDIDSLKWSSICLKALKLPEVDITQKLGNPILSTSDCGTIGHYFIKKYGFHQNCLISVFSGDNPNSASFTLRKQGDISISLGTSNTIFGYIEHFKPNSGEGHVFISPFYETKSDRFFAMSVFKNGGIVKKDVRNILNIQDWNEFDDILLKTKPGNNGHIGFYFKFPEITPTTSKSGFLRFDNKSQSVDYFEKEIEIRAIVESQFMLLKIHGKKLGIENPKRIIATGGGSTSKVCLQILSDIFNCPVYTNDNQNSAPFGAALRACHTFNIFVDKHLLPIGKTDYTALISNLPDFDLVSEPNGEAHKIYQELEENFCSLEKKVVNQLN